MGLKVDTPVYPRFQKQNLFLKIEILIHPNTEIPNIKNLQPQQTQKGYAVSWFLDKQKEQVNPC